MGRSILAAAFILGASAALAWLAPDYISAEWSQRLLGALLGAVVVAYSNAIPKILTARARAASSPAADQAARRFAGWSLVLGGLGYMGASLFAPIGMASLVGAGLLGTGLLLAVLRCLGVGASGSRT
ncbi:hypothetical protein C7C56_008205 [Massilia glaciei]|uniref:Uncharacterized protein n=1 Tax=Massilia glaciei TaxID=1524097 RepID=A0A2U2HNR2_9BURK|nr:hypothetical protein C7C56_008205 [Massilia glaciei]